MEEFDFKLGIDREWTTDKWDLDVFTVKVFIHVTKNIISLIEADSIGSEDDSHVQVSEHLSF